MVSFTSTLSLGWPGEACTTTGPLFGWSSQLKVNQTVFSPGATVTVLNLKSAGMTFPFSQGGTDQKRRSWTLSRSPQGRCDGAHTRGSAIFDALSRSCERISHRVSGYAGRDQHKHRSSSQTRCARGRRDSARHRGVPLPPAALDVAKRHADLMSVLETTIASTWPQRCAARSAPRRAAAGRTTTRGCSPIRRPHWSAQAALNPRLCVFAARLVIVGLGQAHQELRGDERVRGLKR